MDKSFEEFNSRRIYTTLTSEIIDTTEDYKLLQTIFDNIETIFEEGEQYTKDKISKLTKGQQAIFSIWMLQAEVNNGGFNQFYYNSSGQFSEMAKDGLEYIGAEKLAELVEKANKTYSDIKAELDSKDDGTIESFSESYEDNPLNDFDHKFYELEKAENLDSLQIVFIRENKEEFIKQKCS
ncbi:DMP19 family protein [Croceimicrobium hydrocarbonivorans]|uniref:DMP19 family protein n=1 Tax=Croceimicrobium hydrocarbonivorans TaxID=2761580 RepID=A0A7H0VJW2_9FLAO|nr:DMP19 family protein [Croceimicrobium hydrocarbonivorans]